MTGKRSVFVPALLLVTAGALALADPPPVARTSAIVRLHKALKDLRGRRFTPAEQQALALAEDAEHPMPRAWVVVADARQQREDYAGAVTAYQKYLPVCGSRTERTYILQQIRRCREAQSPGDPRKTPGESLTAQQLRALAEIKGSSFTETSDHFVVRARNPLVARLVADEAERALRRVCHVVLGGSAYPHSVDIYVWADEEDYAAHGSPLDGANGSFRFTRNNGLLTRRIDLTQRDKNGRFSTKMLDRVLPHEMCHLVVAELFGDVECPLFLNEGLAMLAESGIDTDRLSLAGVAILSEQDIPMRHLLAADQYDTKATEIFYAEALSLTLFLHGRMTSEQFNDFLTQVRGGCTVSEAVQRALCIPYDEHFSKALADAWREHAVRESQFIEALKE